MKTCTICSTSLTGKQRLYCSAACKQIAYYVRTRPRYRKHSRNPAIKDLTGKRFGKLLALSLCDKRVKGRTVWLFRCDCGREAKIRSKNVLRSDSPTRSCGCTKYKYKSKKESGVARIRRSYRRNAKDRNHVFKLSHTECEVLFSSDCYYCGSPPSNCYYDYIYSGIDRVDNGLGYIPENVVSCCATCNRVKKAMGLDEFRDWIKRVYLHLKHK